MIRELSFEDQVETINLALSGTVLLLYSHVLSSTVDALLCNEDFLIVL